MTQHNATSPAHEKLWRIVTETEYDLAPGVRQFKHRLVGDQLLESLNMVEIDPINEWIRLEPVSSARKVDRLETVGNLLAELGKEGKRVIAGINGDFFSYAGVPSGLQMVEGEIITSPETTKVAMAVLRDGSVQLVDLITMKAELRCENGYIIPVAMLNRARTPKQTELTGVYTWRYGESAPTNSPDGPDIIISSPEQQVTLLPGVPVHGTIRSFSECGENRLTPDTWIVSVCGSKAEDIRQHVKPGEAVSLHISYDKGIQNAVQVISGNSTLAFVLLKDGTIPASLLDPSVRMNSDRHPRTFLATKSGKLYLIAVDGRQSGYSDGMTLAEQAAYLQQLGMEQAINLDGGGSTTCYMRKPGEARAERVNQPSDGFERKVGNALAVISTAPTCELSKLVVSPDPVQALAGSRISFTVQGHDRYLNAVELTAEDIHWSLEGPIGTITDDGLWTAGTKAASGFIIVRHGSTTHSVQVHVTETVARLELDPVKAEIEPGGCSGFQVRAFDEQNNVIYVTPNLLSWTADRHIGEIDAEGVLHALNGTVRGTVSAAWGSLRAEAIAHIGKPHLMIADFEAMDALGIQEAGTVPGSVALTQVARPSPVRFGTFSGKLTYQFSNGGAVSSHVSVTILDAQGHSGRVIEGRPFQFGMWVCGDRSGHHLELRIEDAEGNRLPLALTDSDGLHWKGWKYVCAKVQSVISFPIRVHAISLIGTEGAKQAGGVIYMDHFRAEYVDFEEDVEGPTFCEKVPAEDAQIRNRRPLIQVTVTDKGSGVDPSSIRVWLNDTHVRHRYTPTSGRIEYMPDADLEPGNYCVVIEASDRARNAAIPALSWCFTIVP